RARSKPAERDGNDPCPAGRRVPVRDEGVGWGGARGPSPVPPARHPPLVPSAVGPGATEVAPDRRREALQLAGVLGFQSARLPVLALDGLVHLLAVYGDLDGGRDPQSDLVAPDIHHGDDDVVT